jgi:hypothetical protein
MANADNKINKAVLNTQDLKFTILIRVILLGQNRLQCFSCAFDVSVQQAMAFTWSNIPVKGQGPRAIFMRLSKSGVQFRTFPSEADLCLLRAIVCCEPRFKMMGGITPALDVLSSFFFSFSLSSLLFGLHAFPLKQGIML